MKNLSETWYVEPLFDYEYKTYELLSYIQGVDAQFSENKLQPYLAHLRRHIDQLIAYRYAKEEVEGGLRRELSDIDLKKLRLIRAAIPDEQGVMAELDAIIAFAEERLNMLYRDGAQLLDQLSEEVYIEPVGILGAPDQPGWLLFRKPKSVRVYSYHFRLVRRPYSQESYKDVCTTYLTEIEAGRFSNLSSVKWSLLKMRGAAENHAPNAYAVEAQSDLPQHETLLPIAKAFLISTLA